jgi:anaerobic magnesium-protoporphyrin IX monomethyl ester cyclase
MGKIVLFAGVDPLATGESDYPWHPLSVLTVGTALKAAGHTPILIDCQIHPDWRDQIARHAPDAAFVGVTCMTGPSIGNVLTAIDVVRACAPGVPVVWGGYHASLAYRGILREGHAEVAVVGPGELAAVALANLASATGHLHDPDALARIPGIAYLDGRKALTGQGATAARVCATQPAPPPDMNSLPTLDYSLLPVTDYFTESVRDLSAITSYGCPYACSFCSEPTTSLRRWKPLAPARVARELTDLWTAYRPDRISLLDPNFSTNTARVVAIVEALEALGTPIQLRANMRTRDVVKLARELDLRRLREIGFSAIFVGCESGSDRMLKILRKDATVADTREAVRLLSEAGITQLTSWIHDLPGEEAEDSAETLALVRELAGLPHNEQKHHLFTPFPSTELYDALFDPARDDGRTQADWASSSTYGAGAIWSGRPEFRRRVLTHLELLRQDFPHVLVRALPTV